MKKQEERKIDYFYKENRFINSNSIKVDKALIRKVWVNRILSVIFSFALGLSFVYFAFYLQKYGVKIYNEEYKIKDYHIFNINDTVGFSTEKKTPVDNLLFFLNLKSGCKGEIVSLPFGIANIDDKIIVMKDNQYAIKCLDGPCIKDETLIVDEKNIYGTLLEKE